MISTILLIGAIFLAVLFGAQTEAWSWGPALLVLGLSGLARCLAYRKPVEATPWIWAPLVLAAAWIAYRCVSSPVMDFARADGLLLISLLAVAWVAGGVDTEGSTGRVLFVGLAAIVLANGSVALVQWKSPDFMWPYSNRPTESPTGFFSHYNYFSNFQLGAGLMLLARVFLSRDARWLRALYGAAFVLSAASIAISGSRGGLFALSAGLFLALAFGTLVAWRRKSRLFPGLVVILPLIVILGFLGLWKGLARIQVDRGLESSAVALADSNDRLGWSKLAFKVMGNHPLTGGGSRSYSWERNQQWDFDEFGQAREDEPFVHNELLQLATDYGWVGVILVGACLVAAGGVGIAGLFVGSVDDRTADDRSDPVYVGALSALGGMLVQANLSFVFHMLPSVLILGLALGLIGTTRCRVRPRRETGISMRAASSLVSLVLAVPLVWMGFLGSRTLKEIWPVFYGDPLLKARAPELALRTYERAHGYWGGFRLEEERANLALASAADPMLSAEERIERLEIAVEANRSAAEIHPFHPGLAVNGANILSALNRDDEAEAEYLRAIDLQGGLEIGFRAKLNYAMHLYKVWFRRWREERRAGEALAQFYKALKLIDEVEPIVGWPNRNAAKPLRANLKEAISYLEGARITPVDPDK